MAFVVTARKWRPQKFTDVVGQEHITVTLKNAISNNRIAHAYIFAGPRGVGKTTTARILAKALNCLNPVDAEPCNECEMCKSIQSTQSLDIIEIDGASNRGIDEIRTLRDSVKYAPTKGKYKIYIIDEVHMLTKESFNAFLKTLEEPPAHTVFIFATTDIHKVPLTIISRCQRFDFRRIQLDTIKSLLSQIAESEKISIDDKTLTIIAKKADGALRDAESFFDQIVSFCGNKVDNSTVSKMLNLIDDEIYFAISDAVLSKDFKTVFEVSKKIYDNGWDFIDFMDGLIEHFRNIMTVVLSKNANLVETADIYKTRYLGYAERFSEGDTLRLLNFLNKTQQELRYSQNQKLKIEISLSHLIGLEKSSTLSEIISELNNSGNSESNSISEPPKTKISLPENKNSEYNPAQTNPEKKTAERKINNSVPSKILETNNIEDPHFNFNTVVQKWAGFVESVCSEKGLIFGPVIKNIQLVGLEGNKLSVRCSDQHSKDIVNRNQDYISKKTLEYYGKKMSFNFADNQIKNEVELKSVTDNSLKAKSGNEKKDVPQNSFADAVINELGGEEIT
ncbi:MAG: DNA polymerase III subunit gamma/tau [Bacteroidetes bacterium]|nr:DNA polymerase III subunit gamma/tau [Bacteroidota bacterium]